MKSQVQSANKIRISVVVPAKNEELHIRVCLESLLDQSIDSESYEVIVADGNSQDQTASIIAEIQKTRPNLLMVENRAGITPVGMNLGIRRAQGDVIVIAGAHSTYPRHFLERALESLQKTGADVVGGPCVTVAADNTLSSRLVAAILSSPFGVGNSKFRTSLEEGFVDTVPFGAFRREIFDKVGMYNEKLVRNQDNDLNARIRMAGGKIYITPELKTYYHPVKTFLGLLKYAFKTSTWHVFTLRENMQSMSARHLAPAALVILLLTSLLLLLAKPVALAFLIGMLVLYVSAGFYFSLRTRNDKNWDVALVQPFATLCFHVAYGAGTLFGLRYLFVQPSAVPVRTGLRINT